MILPTTIRRRYTTGVVQAISGPDLLDHYIAYLLVIPQTFDGMVFTQRHPADSLTVT